MSGRKRSVGLDPELYELAKDYSEGHDVSMNDALIAVLSSGGGSELAETAAAVPEPEDVDIRPEDVDIREDIRELGDHLDRNTAALLQGQQAIAGGAGEEETYERQKAGLFGEAKRQGLPKAGYRVLDAVTGSRD